MEQVLAAGRNELLRLAGQGCGEGEQLVARLAFGLAGPREARRAQLHLATCGRCGALYERLDLWREHVAGLLPLPAAAEAHSHLLERAIHAGSELLSGSAHRGRRRRATARDGDGVASARAGGGELLRAVDPTPLAGVRPGVAAAAVAVVSRSAAARPIAWSRASTRSRASARSRRASSRTASRSRISVGCVSRRPDGADRHADGPGADRDADGVGDPGRRAADERAAASTTDEPRRRRRRSTSRPRSSNSGGQFAAGVVGAQQAARAGGWPSEFGGP